MKTTIYHNPRCSKSRATLALLHERGIEPEVINYLETPPDQTTLAEVLDKLNMQPRELIRKGESVYKEQELNNADLTQQQLIKAMVDSPILIERPIVVVGDKARIGRPPENVLDIL
ncbi:MAG TPA: arsenate reductase (glutaredoxin) [Gammaproteobacteria bacterium]|nr:arsenate reductase (glutaredoxin) [Gammaproteobacteria bacterium]